MEQEQIKIMKGYRDIAHNYIGRVRDELSDRWEKWKKDLTKTHTYEVIGGILARQVSLATNTAGSLSICTAHIAPLVLRAMADNYLNLAWIFLSPDDRSKKFIEYGLGKAKLHIEKVKIEIESRGENISDYPFIEVAEQHLNSQKFTFLTEVDIGSWTGKTTLAMAIEAGCEDFHRLVYQPFSDGLHSTWHHIEQYNLEQCKSPLHKNHRIPLDKNLYWDIDYLYRAAKYVEKAFKLFDKEAGHKTSLPSAFDELAKELDEFHNELNNSGEKETIE